MQYFDTHAHIGLIYDDPIEQLLVCQEAKQAGVTRIVSICNSLMDFKQVYDNLKTMEHVFHAAGVSPSEVQNPGKDWHRTIEEAVKLPRVIALGEIGLDYYHKFGDRKSQIELFIDQLDLAARLEPPGHHPQPRGGQGRPGYPQGPAAALGRRAPLLFRGRRLRQARARAST